MLVRLRDFAELHRISERTVQVHIKENYDLLKDHIDRRGKQGTWLDDFAVEFLLNHIQLPTKDEVLVPTPREAALLVEVANANKALAEAERRAAANAEAAGKVMLLEATNESQMAQINQLNQQIGGLIQEKELLERFIQDAKQEIAELTREKAQEVSEARSEASEASRREQEALDAKQAAEDELRAFDKLSVWQQLKELRRRKNR